MNNYLAFRFVFEIKNGKKLDNMEENFVSDMQNFFIEYMRECSHYEMLKFEEEFKKLPDGIYMIDYLGNVFYEETNEGGGYFSECVSYLLQKLQHVMIDGTKIWMSV